MRILLVTGKGGVGKTSVAAATAVRASRRGLRTLVTSTDPAHSLADALDVDVGADPTPVAPLLDASQIDAQLRLEQQWGEIRSYLGALFAWTGVGEVEAEELAVLPGLEEILALVDLRRHAEAGRHDLLVVDCAPTAETLRLLSLPDVLGWYLERAFPVERALRVVRPVLGRVTNLPLPAPAVMTSVETLARDLDAVRTLLTDAARTSVRLVVNAEKVVVAEARRTFTYLHLFGYHVDAVVVNRLLPDEVRDPYFARWKALQAEHLATIRDGFDGITVRTAPLLADEPIGVDRLDVLAGHLWGDDAPEANLRDGTPMRLERTADGYELRLHLPHATGDDVDMALRGEELYLTVGPYRRAILLPAALRRAEVGGASLRDGRLQVRFTLPPSAA